MALVAAAPVQGQVQAPPTRDVGAEVRELRDHVNARERRRREETASLESEVRRLRQEVDRHGDDGEDTGNYGFVLFLFGAFCALWAQNTGRSPWLWFLGGVFLNVLVVIVLLIKNANDRRDAAPKPRLDLNEHRVQ
ncbi:MAG TPA: hypothetical protein VEX86_03175 [Longimicrobium sp.]|nr:hypothetical protein [Longimicrobium sp.]